jgi:hypothetical protein
VTEIERVFIVLALIVLAIIVVVQHGKIEELRNDVKFWKARDAQWRDPNQPRPLPVGTRYGE